MNESRFIELLNLYVDRQLSAGEAAELEAEIKRDADRRRTYWQYCRMQRACAQLFENERSTAPHSAVLTRAMADADRKIIGFPEGAGVRPVWTRGYTMAALGAAACVAFTLVWQHRMTERPSEMLAQPSRAPAVAGPEHSEQRLLAEAVASPVTPNAENAGSRFEPVRLEQVRWMDASGSDSSAFLADAGAGAAMDELAWTHDVQLKPIRKISADELTFPKRLPVDANMRAVSSQPADEMAAFQFQR